MHYALVRLHIEVEIHLRPPHMRVRGHGVPVAPRRQQGKAHHQLAALDPVAVNRLVDRPLVAGLRRTQRHALQIGTLHHRRRMHRVRRIAQQIKRRRRLRRLARKRHRLAAPPHVQAVQLVQLIRRAVHGHLALPARIQHAQLAALQKVVRAQLRLRLQRQRRARRHGRSDHGPVEVHIRVLDLAGVEHPFQQKRLAQLRARHPRIAHRVSHLKQFHGSPSCPHAQS